MAKIVLTASISGTRDGKAWPPRGTEVDLPDAEAQSMVDGGTAVWPDDWNPGGLSDVELAGAPEGRDWTEGQADTNLTRAKAMTLAKEENRAAARKAAKESKMDDAHTVPGANPDEPVVGDGKPSPLETAALAPATEQAADTSKPAGRKAANGGQQ